MFKTKARQATTTVASDGSDSYVASTRIGQLFTADWRQKLLLAGRCWRVTVGTFSAGADISPVTGGGNATTIDLDRPEIAIGIGSGYYMIPMEIRVGGQVDLDNDAEVGNIIAIGDRVRTVPTSVTGTIETPVNLLDGGPSFPGTAYSGINSADIQDPTDDEIFDFATVRVSEFISNGSATNLHNGVTATLRMLYEPKTPSILKGPCGIYVLWGGTAAVTGMATVVVAVVPSEWFS